MKYIVYLLGSLYLISCSSAPMKNLKESIALEEIVYQQTEGLLILEKILSSPNCENVNMICEKIIFFYAESQPNLLQLCNNKELNITMTAYKEINEDIEKLFQDSSSYSDYLVDKLLINLYDQKSFYLHVLKDSELVSMHIYALESYLQLICFIDDMKYLLQKTYTQN